MSPAPDWLEGVRPRTGHCGSAAWFLPPRVAPNEGKMAAPLDILASLLCNGRKWRHIVHLFHILCSEVKGIPPHCVDIHDKNLNAQRIESSQVCPHVET